VCQFSLVAPSEYQPSSSTAKHAGQLLALLAEVSPRAVNSQLSQLQPYLACKAATIRAGLVSAVGSVLQQVRRHIRGRQEPSDTSRAAAYVSCYH
jgi:hypothetical protein